MPDNFDQWFIRYFKINSKSRFQKSSSFFGGKNVYSLFYPAYQKVL